MTASSGSIPRSEIAGLKAKCMYGFVRCDLPHFAGLHSHDDSAFFFHSLYNKRCIMLLNFLGKNFDSGSYKDSS